MFFSMFGWATVSKIKEHVFFKSSNDVLRRVLVLILPRPPLLSAPLVIVRLEHAIFSQVARDLFFVFCVVVPSLSSQLASLLSL